MTPRFAFFALWLPLPAAGDPVVSVPYGSLVPELTQRVDFERLPQRAEPGFNLDMPVYSDGAWLGERFEGQQLAHLASGHDTVEPGTAAGTLHVVAGARGQNLSVAFHPGFGSNAVFPLGAAGFPELSARGEGALAVAFDADQAAVGFRVHAEYADPFGTRPEGGAVDVLFFARGGSLIARLRHIPGPGISSFGYRRDGDRRDIAGFVILNTDPGGIAVDDIIFALPPLLG